MKHKKTYAWDCEICGVENHELDGECQFCGAGVEPLKIGDGPPYDAATATGMYDRDF